MKNVDMNRRFLFRNRGSIRINQAYHDRVGTSRVINMRDCGIFGRSSCRITELPREFPGRSDGIGIMRAERNRIKCASGIGQNKRQRGIRCRCSRRGARTHLHRKQDCEERRPRMKRDSIFHDIDGTHSSQEKAIGIYF